MWILIIVFSNAAINVEFRSQKTCDEARVQIYTNQKVHSTYCFKK